MKTTSLINPDEYRERLEKASDIYIYNEVYHQLGYSVNVEMTDEEREDYINQLVGNYEFNIYNYKK